MYIVCSSIEFPWALEKEFQSIIMLSSTTSESTLISL